MKEVVKEDIMGFKETVKAEQASVLAYVEESHARAVEEVEAMKKMRNEQANVNQMLLKKMIKIEEAENRQSKLNKEY